LVFDGWAGAILALGKLSSLEFTDSDFIGNRAGVSGAIWIDGGTSSFQRCLFDSNFCGSGGFGGAVVPEGTSANRFEDCEFRNNYCEYGGAIDDGTQAVTLFQQCVFKNNSALYGGGYYAFADSKTTFEECHFDSNWATHSGGAAEISSTTRPVFSNCVFRNNEAPVSNALSIIGGAITTIVSCHFEVSDGGEESAASGGHLGITADTNIKGCSFEGGQALQGGSIFIRASHNLHVTIQNSQFGSNQAVSQGGAVYIEGYLDSNAVPRIEFENCKFQRNKAKTNGGAISMTGTSNFNFTLENCVFEENEGGSSGGAIAVQKEMRVGLNQCHLENNYAPTGGAVFVSDSSLLLAERSSFVGNSARFGGSLAQTLGGRLVISDSEVRHSKAVFEGGAFFANNLATGCNLFHNVKFAQNQAAVAGGAIYFASRSPNPSCVVHTDDPWVVDIDSSEYPEKRRYDSCQFEGNKAGYGPNYATGASMLLLLNSDSRRTQHIRLQPSEEFEVNLRVVDFYQQTLKGFIDMQVQTKFSVSGTKALNETDQRNSPFSD